MTDTAIHKKSGRTLLTDDEKTMSATFRVWLKNPTNADIRKRFVNAMIEFEIKTQIKRQSQ